MATVTICDETTTGERMSEFTLDLLEETLSVEELIRSRVYQEVKDYNTSRPELYRGLVEPRGAERVLGGGARLDRARNLDWREQFEAAVRGFERGRILVLVDDRQVEGLDDAVVIGTGTRVTFLKLVPLVGG